MIGITLKHNLRLGGMSFTLNEDQIFIKDDIILPKEDGIFSKSHSQSTNNLEIESQNL